MSNSPSGEGKLPSNSPDKSKRPFNEEGALRFGARRHAAMPSTVRVPPTSRSQPRMAANVTGHVKRIKVSIGAVHLPW